MAQPLRRQILLVIVALTVVAYSAIGYGMRRTYEEQLAQLRNETSTLAATVVAYVNRNLDTADAVAETAARHPAMRALDANGASEVLRPLINGRDRLLRNAFIADVQGHVAAWAGPPDSLVEGAVDSAWIKTVADRRESLISPMLGGAGDAAHMIVLGYPILSGEAVVGVLGLAVHLEALDRMLAAIPMPAGSVVTLTDANSVVVARSLDASQYVGRSAAPEGKPRNPSDVPKTAILTGVDGIERVFGNAVVSRGPWLASVGIPTAAATERTWPIYRRNVGISIFSTVVVIALTIAFARGWLNAFDHLDAAARRVSRGDLAPMDLHPMPTEELDRLQQTFSSMVGNLQRARESIAAQVEDERRMRQELQLLQQQVIRQERLAAIGVLVSGVAHELNNPLQGILGFSELLQMQPGMPEQAKGDLALIQKEATRASAIIRNLSRFGRQQAEPSPVRLRDVVASVMELRQRKLEELGVAVDIDEQSHGYVMAIYTELQQVLLNFVINAEQAIVANTRGRRMIVRTGDRDGWAWIEVEDSGVGVPAEDEAKLFQPFYTRKPVGEGTGLGLSVSYDIIRLHGGRIGYRGAPSGGAVFFFELPIVPPDSAKS